MPRKKKHVRRPVESESEVEASHQRGASPDPPRRMTRRMLAWKGDRARPQSSVEASSVVDASEDKFVHDGQETAEPIDLIAQYGKWCNFVQHHLLFAPFLFPFTTR